jgi:metal-responsive CopG/Arc/MetJ family transcriptional regulator
MRTTISLTDDQIQALDRLRAIERASRAELIRRAVDAFLQTKKGASIAERPGFGAWKNRRVDGVTYQRKMRAEWESV